MRKWQSRTDTLYVMIDVLSYNAEVLGNTAGQLRDDSRLFLHFCVGSFEVLFTVKFYMHKNKKIRSNSLK